MIRSAYENNEDTLDINTTGNSDTKIAEDLLDNSNNQVRIIINPSVTVENGKIFGLGFANKNMDRYLQCKIKVSNGYVYDTMLVSPNQSISNDLIDSNLKTGMYEAIAEIYSYDMDKQLCSQTNVEVQVNSK